MLLKSKIIFLKALSVIYKYFSNEPILIIKKNPMETLRNEEAEIVRRKKTSNLVIDNMIDNKS